MVGYGPVYGLPEGGQTGSLDLETGSLAEETGSLARDMEQEHEL